MSPHHRLPLLEILTIVMIVLAMPCLASAQELVSEEESTPAPDNDAESAAPVEVARVSHVNHSIVIFDEHDRRYVLPDGRYATDDGVLLVIGDGRIQRMVGCGAEPCDLTTHSTRIVDRSLLLYAEIAVPDGTYLHESGRWMKIAGGELVEFFGNSQ